MAADGGAPMDQQAHAETYAGFLMILKIGTAISILTAAAVILLIAN